ncbi:MAG: Hsp20/alpha crystallin family protein [Bacteroidetes bacterium]|nr:Hsp20/alpha crystallin family protein [Bacteroidota bacterium]
MTTLVKSNGLGRQGLFPEFPDFFDDLFTKDLFHPAGKLSGVLPAVNVKDTEQNFILEVAVPGMDKKDFKVEFKKNMLVISARKENQSEEKDKEGKYVRKEFGYQSFTRSFTLPEDMVDGDNISANYKDGILNVTIPKKEREKTRSKEIEIG